MTADSLRAIEAASIIVENKGRGTLTNEQGVFSIAVLKGDEIRFSCVGFRRFANSFFEIISAPRVSRCSV